MTFGCRGPRGWRTARRAVAGGEHGGDETNEIPMPRERIVPNRCLKEEVAWARFFSRQPAGHRNRYAAGSVQQRAPLRLDPAVGLDPDREVEDAAGAVGRDARNPGPIDPETVGGLVDPPPVGAVEGHLQRVRLGVGCEGRAHFTRRLVGEATDRVGTVVRPGNGDPRAYPLGM